VTDLNTVPQNSVQQAVPFVFRSPNETSLHLCKFHYRFSGLQPSFRVTKAFYKSPMMLCSCTEARHSRGTVCKVMPTVTIRNATAREVHSKAMRNREKEEEETHIHVFHTFTVSPSCYTFVCLSVHKLRKNSGLLHRDLHEGQ
jgi:hypothetical protein